MTDVPYAIVTLFNKTQPLNTSYPILSTLLPIETVVSFTQLLNALLHISVTLFGMVNVVILLFL